MGPRPHPKSPSDPPGAHTDLDADRAEQERQVEQAHRDEEGEDGHGALSQPARDPDETEYPNPYDKRPDPRDPAAFDTPADPADPEAVDERDDAPQDPSTSDPHPQPNIDRAHYEGHDREP